MGTAHEYRDADHIYAGIGSRSTPNGSLNLMERVGMFLAREGWVLRSGGARGADAAFEAACDAAHGPKEIFQTKDAQDWAYEEAAKHIPANRPDFSTWKPHTRGLIARNMMQILGIKGDRPVKMVICWTQADVQDGGGTGYALRCAASRNIPIYNLNDHEALTRVVRWLELEKIDV